MSFSLFKNTVILFICFVTMTGFCDVGRHWPGMIRYQTQHVKRFSWGIMAKSTVNIIASVAPALQTNSGISYYLFQGRKPPSYHSRQIPPPKPPKTKKDDIFSLEKYQYVDDYVLNVSHRFHLYNSTTNQLGWYIYVYSHSVSFSFFF